MNSVFMGVGSKITQRLMISAIFVARKGPEEYAVWRDAIKSLKQHAVQTLRETVGPVDVQWAAQTGLRELREKVV